MKLRFNVNRSQPDPYIFADGGRYYLYVTAHDGVEAYESDSICGVWQFRGVIGSVPHRTDYWAPSIIKLDGRYYIYVSCTAPGDTQCMYVLSADSPLGPFGNAVKLYEHFTIDSHVVQTEDGLFLWFAQDNKDPAIRRIGTRVYVDRLLDPITPAHQPKEVILPTFDEEIFKRNRYGDGRDWHTIEGAFWFEQDGWQYLMYSGGCYENDSYHIGYCTAHTAQSDLTRVDFVKHTDSGAFDPLLIKNDFEEGVGHHSVIRLDGTYYAIYHGRDYLTDEASGASAERRTARICRLHVKDGVITAERYEDRI